MKFFAEFQLGFNHLNPNITNDTKLEQINAEILLIIFCLYVYHNYS